MAIAVSESDFMAEINTNTRPKILVCVAVLLLETIVGVLTARCVTLPLRLNEAVKDIAAREFDRAVAVSRIESAN
ncbi:hypothetical protein [Microcoleus sp. F4-D5]|uniref:hypothetical protein n=1 Tax=Microcoleus sp. F4-D5 TaxID=2818760 RepID=UPI002FD675B4